LAVTKVINQLGRAKTEQMLIDLLAPIEDAIKVLYNGSKVYWYGTLLLLPCSPVRY
jgi:hypothetical protein